MLKAKSGIFWGLEEALLPWCLCLPYECHLPRGVSLAVCANVPQVRTVWTVAQRGTYFTSAEEMAWPPRQVKLLAVQTQVGSPEAIVEGENQFLKVDLRPPQVPIPTLTQTHRHADMHAHKHQNYIPIIN